MTDIGLVAVSAGAGVFGCLQLMDSDAMTKGRWRTITRATAFLALTASWLMALVAGGLSVIEGML